MSLLTLWNNGTDVGKWDNHIGQILFKMIQINVIFFSKSLV